MKGRSYTTEENNDAFRKRLRGFHRSAEGRSLRDQIQQIRRELRGVYLQIAITHWQERGNDASTGWGCTPEGQYQPPLKPEHCAAALADKLTDAMLDNPTYALGAK